MDNWRVELNRLTTEFWIGVGVQSEVIVWLEGIPQHVKGVNSKVSELYAFQTYEEATEALCQIAKNVNGFIPNSWEAEPYAIITLKKHINLFLDKKYPLFRYVLWFKRWMLILFPMVSQGNQDHNNFKI